VANNFVFFFLIFSLTFDGSLSFLSFARFFFVCVNYSEQKMIANIPNLIIAKSPYNTRARYLTLNISRVICS